MSQNTAAAAVAVVGPIGQTLFVDADDQRGQLMIQTAGQFNPESLRLWNLALRLASWDVVVDVGSNYGQMLACVDLSGFPKIYAFEPNQRILPQLARTIAALPWPVELVDAGVADEDSADRDFTVDLTWSGTSTLGDHLQSDAAGHEYVVQHVRTVSLDSFLGGRGTRSACIKIDVEGHEAQVLAGARRFLGSVDTAAVMFEILHMPADEILEFSAGFELYMLDVQLNQLVRIDGDLEAIAEALAADWLYRQDALIVAASGRLPGLGTAVGAASARERLLGAADAALEAALAAPQPPALEPAPEPAPDPELLRLRAELAAWHGSRSYQLTAPLRAASRAISSLRRNARG